jgi:nicotinamide phosphoribosyltransferase
MSSSNKSYSRSLNTRFDAYGRLKPNLILATDIYKFSHSFAYPDNITGMFAYQEARSKNDIIVPVGMQMLLAKTLANPISMEDIDEADEFCRKNGALFDRTKWEYILSEYQGYLPVTIRTVREGTPVKSGNVIVTVECTDPVVFWLASYIETFLLRGIWYPTTIASNDRAIKIDLANFYRITGAPMEALAWALNDFGARGVTSAEQAEIGGAAHMVSFSGSDTTEGIRAANLYYNCDMAAMAVPATEHSIECSFGLDVEGEEEYLQHVLKNLAKPGGIVSIVIDGRDMYRCAARLCSPKFVKLIKECGAKVVFRPDSGDMMITVPAILKMQAEAFGYVVNEQGYKVINFVGVIQGDGIDPMSARSLIGKVVALGYRADAVVLGSGGGLLQKVNRDTYKFAQKASAILVNGKWVGISKDPVTDPGKQSKKGRLQLGYNKIKKEHFSYDIDVPINSLKLDEFFESELLVLVYDHGTLYNQITLEEVRANAALV